MNKMMKGVSFNDMPKQRIAHNVITYNILIDGYCKSRRIEDAFALCNTMLGRGICPNASTFIRLIAGLCRKGYAEEACSLIELSD